MYKNLMHYTIASNFDDALIDFIRENDLSHQITSVYGKLPEDIFGGGRTALLSPKITFADLKRHVFLCQDAGLSFNYLFNGICMSGREILPSTHNEFLKLVYELCNIGISQITVVSPYLCELLKTQFPHLKISIGSYAFPHHLQEIQSWINLGADEITLPNHFSRDFTALRQLLMHYKNTPIKFRLIANNSCLHYCPYALNHACYMSHQSQTHEEIQSLNIDYSLLKCKSTEIKNPAMLLASEWIRPEDVHYYTELCRETGNFNLSLKLVERTKNTAFLTNVAKAYLNESYEGNLIDLLNWPSDLNTAAPINKRGNGEKAIHLGYSLPKYIQYTRCLTPPPITLDNKKLDGFLEHFIYHNHCSNHICGLTTSSGAPNTCYHCLNWVSKAISYNEEEVNKWLSQVNEAFDNLKQSSLFTPSSEETISMP